MGRTRDGLGTLMLLALIGACSSDRDTAMDTAPVIAPPAMQPIAGAAGSGLPPPASVTGETPAAPPPATPAPPGDGAVGDAADLPASAPAGDPAGDGTAPSAGDGDAMDDTAPDGESPAATLPPVTDYGAPGPFATTMESGSGPSGGHTIFRPEPLGADGFLHPPIIWGPGILTSVDRYTQLLTTFASHGFVVVAVDRLNAGPNAEANRTPMLEGLEWILAQNDQPGVYQGKLDVQRAVSMGYSVGGTAAVEIAGHEAIATTVSIHGHVAQSDMHGPLLQTTGTQDTVGLPMQEETYAMSQVQTFLATVSGASHTYILADGGGAQRAAIVAWLRYWIFDDQGARPFFFGDDCTLCQPPWENPQRKNWN